MDLDTRVSENNGEELSSLTTTNKTLPGAINELHTKIGAARLQTNATTVAGAINELVTNQTHILQKEVTIPEGETIGVSADDETFIGTIPIGILPKVDNSVNIGVPSVSATGSVSVTIESSASQDEVFIVSVVKALT